MEIFAIIVAAGKGERMQSKIKKQYINLGSNPILSTTLSIFLNLDYLTKILLVIPKQDNQFCINNILKPFNISDKVILVEGGKIRQESVFNGLKKLETISTSLKKSLVIIHDGVRPFAEPSIIKTCIDKAVKYNACITGLPVNDSLKRINKDNFVSKGISRDNVYTIQTPQVFNLDLIIKAHKNAIQNNFIGTDDSSIVEYYGKKVFVVKGSEKNIKITTQNDINLAKLFLNS